MNFTDIKLPIAVVVIIVAQAFGIIWYVATLDSTVSQLQVVVEEIRLNTADTSVAVIQNDIATIKADIEKMERNVGMGLTPGVTAQELEEATGELSVRRQNILDQKGATWRKSALQARIEGLEKAIEKNHPPKKKR